MALNYGICLGEESREYTSDEFCKAIQAVFGDGICKYGSEFEMTPAGFGFNVSTGYALGAGRFLKNNGKFSATPTPSSNVNDRYDALAMRVDYTERHATLCVLEGIDAEAVKKDPAIVRNALEYCLVLYLIHIRRGTTTISPNDVEDVRDNSDLCGRIISLREASGDILYIYKYLTEGIDAKAEYLMDESKRILQKGDTAISRIQSILVEKGVAPVVGELRTATSWPPPEDQWLLCNGAAVGSEYKELIAIIGSKTPNIVESDNRLDTYIYGGKPQTNYLTTIGGSPIVFGNTRILIGGQS